MVGSGIENVPITVSIFNKTFLITVIVGDGIVKVNDFTLGVMIASVKVEIVGDWTENVAVKALAFTEILVTPVIVGLGIVNDADNGLAWKAVLTTVYSPLYSTKALL
jgi:hypothetical protein